MNVEKQSTKFLKPSISTPQSYRHYRIGFIDEFVPASNVTIVLFFPQINKINSNIFVELEKSLEKTLIRLYPLAGRYVEDKKIIECNDEGVEFIHAKVNIKLQEFLDSEFSVVLVDEFISFETQQQIDHFTNPLLTIQVTTFECGGVAVGVRASHRIVDASTLCTFLNEWAFMNREESHAAEFTGLVFNSSSLFPPRGLSAMPFRAVTNDMLINYTRKKFSFSESEISNIKTKAIASGKYSNCKWSKVQLVSAIIWNAFRRVDEITNYYRRESVLVQPISLRERMATLIPKDSCGNLWVLTYTRSRNHETTEELADLLTSSVKKTLNNFSKVSHDSKEGQTLVLNSLLHKGNFNESTYIVGISSWCKFPFYETDFGFGKPIWASPGTIPVKNTTVLMDDVTGKGVDAYVFLEKENVPLFKEALECDVFGG
ncbi:pelargonidin 3-O-(6-caffeoylglucoside) 5-O-(6-O-malonylglucoside) 4'''-malonyltransferase-like [Rutidosis leptorrhynchoides]|uniref:pelargonidin 3-O-(6-caffeoylglucoside) 5-O-(6-O-malonylglucoside) 4'''-malonyltransferase-like n=1 Tax=Rutidosis leptorrhynchoides TaxID=125765 RepID=UPI003A99675E